MLYKLILSSFRWCLSIGLGGGGGGSSNSGGNDTLWNAQADQVKQSSAMSGEMFDYWRKYSPQYLDNANTMTKEAMDGTLTNRARTTAGADADQATAAGLKAATRSLDRYGATMNPNAMAHDTKAVALQGAANKADAMSKATQWGENQKWARNQDAYGLTSGMPGNAVASANSAQAGLNGLSSMQNSANSTAAANASGYGVAGATLASTMFRADGGLAKAQRYADGGEVFLAAGGIPKSPVVGWRDRVAAMPTIAKSSNGSSPIASTISGAMPTVASELAKPYLKEAGSAIKDGLADAIGQGRAGIEQMVGVDQSQAAVDVIDKSTMATEVAGDAAATAATDAAASTAADVATTAAAETAATTAAETAATSAATTAVEGVAAANSWNPVGWVLGAMALAGAASKADGGPIERTNMTPGGRVTGAGTNTSDSIPAWLSDDEYVENSEAVGMPRGETKAVVQAWQEDGGDTKDLLERLNEAGLKKRYGDQAVMVDGEAKPNGLADGGMLGIALGAGAQTYSQLQQQKEQNAYRDAAMQLQKDQADDNRKYRDEQLKFAHNAERRAEESHSAVAKSTKLDLGAKEKAFAILNETQDGIRRIRAGDFSPLGNLYNTDVNDGITVGLEKQADGTLAKFVDASGKLVKEQKFGPNDIDDIAVLYENVMGEKMKYVSPEFYQKSVQASREAQEKATARQDKERDRQDKLAMHSAGLSNALDAARIRSGGGGDNRKDAAAIFSEAQKIVTSDDGAGKMTLDSERLGPINALAQNLYRSGQATSPGEAVMLAKDRLADAEFSQSRALQRATMELAQIKKDQNVTGSLNPTGNSWEAVAKQLTGKAVSEEQFVKDLANVYLANGRRGGAIAATLSTDGRAPYPDGTQLTGKDGARYVVQGGKPVPVDADAPTDEAPETPEESPPAAEPVRTPATGNATASVIGENPETRVKDKLRAFIGGLGNAKDVAERTGQKINAAAKGRPDELIGRLRANNVTPSDAAKLLAMLADDPALGDRFRITQEQIAGLRRRAGG